LNFSPDVSFHRKKVLNRRLKSYFPVPKIWNYLHLVLIFCDITKRHHVNLYFSNEGFLIERKKENYIRARIYKEQKEKRYKN
jgi:hypothetical protein